MVRDGSCLGCDIGCVDILVIGGSRRPNSILLIKMGRKKEKGVLHANKGLHPGSTLREEKTGTKQIDVTSVLKIQHLQRIATWAGGDARIGSLAAFFGEQLASNAEASGIPLDPSNVLCERCETIRQPGINCTVRIEKVTKKRRRCKKSRVLPQNHVVFTCHFCSHRNLKWGTAKGHVQALLASQQGPTSKFKFREPTSEMKGNCINGISVTTDIQHTDARQNHPDTELASDLNSSTPDASAAAVSVSAKSSVSAVMKLVGESNKRKASNITPMKFASGSATPDSGMVTGSSNKRRRKGWSSLKDIVESNKCKNDKNISSG